MCYNFGKEVHVFKFRQGQGEGNYDGQLLNIRRGLYYFYKGID